MIQSVLYQSILNAKLTGRKKLCKKMCTSKRKTASLRILSSKADWNTWESFTSSELKLESVHQESPRSDIFRKRATKPLLNQKHHQNHLTWAKEKKKWTVAQWSKVHFSDERNFALLWKSGSQSLEEEWTDTESMLLEVQCEVSTVSDDLGCHVICWCCPLCFLKSTVNAAIYQEILEHFMLSSADKLYGDADFIFQQDLAPTHTAKGTKIWFNDHGVTAWLASKLTWSEPHWESRWETPDPTMQMTWRQLSEQPGLHYTWAVPQTDHRHATPHWCSNSCKRRPNQVLSA